MTAPTFPIETDATRMTASRMTTAHQGATHALRRVALISLLAIVVLAAGLRFINLAAIGDGNLYYTAAVESMLQSPLNFFFVAAEPGGSVTVDKPPVGLWLQALSAAVFGVSGAAVALPQILASIACVPLIYLLVRRHFGVGAGLIAAFIMAVMPVDIATSRNNTMDMTLVLTLLLAAWAFMRATDSGKLAWLIVGALLVGIGFNIKMLQAFLPVPAFFALYLLGARVGWGRRIVRLAIAAGVMVAVSLSWAVVVDAIPANQRPYIGSSANNSVIELMLGYNGINRLTGATGPGGAPSFPGGGGDGAAPGTTSAPPLANVMAGGGMAPPGGGSMFNGETGEPGVLRLFTGALGNEIGWLLPAALLALIVLAVSARPRLPLSERHQAVVLWGGWLLTAGVFFSRAEFFHAYYMVMLTPAIAALVGAGVGVLASARLLRPRAVGLLTVLAAVGVVSYQLVLANSYLGELAKDWTVVLILPIGLMAAALVGTLLPLRGRGVGVGIALAAASALVIPTAWGAATTFDPATNATLPHAWDGRGTFDVMSIIVGSMANGGVDAELLTALEANTTETRYLMAVSSSMIGAPYVLATGRPVLYTGGFSGGDPVADADDLAALVADGELRYVLWNAMGGMTQMFGALPGGAMTMFGGGEEISTWLESACSAVEGLSLELGGMPMPMGGVPGMPVPPAGMNFPRPSMNLYDCAPGV